MCGIAGFLGPSRPDDEATLARMTARLAHRGPDGSGTWRDPEAGVALGHRRLAIVDLSEAGRQPMASADGRWRLTFNGEIYNAPELRGALARAGQAPAWRGHSDTEVLVEAMAQWGVQEALERSVGMFALAAWDRANRVLVLARDRLGEKPLYHGQQGRTHLFASELRPLREHPDWEGRVAPESLDLLIRHDCIPAPHSIFAGVRKLEPGRLLEIRAPGQAREVAYWSPTRVFPAGQPRRDIPTLDEAADGLEDRLRQAIRGQLVADRPLGAFLSGGIDSSTVVALMQRESSTPVRTFTIGFEEAGYDESPAAARVAHHLGTSHAALTLGHGGLLGVIPDLPSIFDEPFADPSMIPTALVARLARGEVTVALSGDGGDELFGGYPRYHAAARLERLTRRLPPALRRGLGRSLGAIVPGPAWSTPRDPALRHRLAAIARRLAAPDPAAAYHAALSRWPDSASLVHGVRAGPGWPMPAAIEPAESTAELMMDLDLVGYLPDDILVKVDRATMAVGLESRAPLLDHRVVEYVRSLPLALRVGPAPGKRVLRQVLHRFVPPALVDRPKHGFGPPIREWLNGPLAEWAEDLLAPGALGASGCLDASAVRALWRHHQAGAEHWTAPLWSVLCFQAWYLAWTGSRGAR